MQKEALTETPREQHELLTRCLPMSRKIWCLSKPF